MLNNELEIMWNSQADEYKQWGELALEEMIEFATKVEREACAKVCEAHTVDDVLAGVGIAQSCADMIRKRSNA